MPGDGGALYPAPSGGVENGSFEDCDGPERMEFGRGNERAASVKNSDYCRSGLQGKGAYIRKISL